MGIEVRTVVRPRTSPSAPAANVAVMEWRPPPDGIAICQGGDVCRIPPNGEGIHEKDLVTRTIVRVPLTDKVAHDDLVCPRPVPSCSHPARRLAVRAFHAQLSRRRRSARGAWARCVPRNGATVGLEVRAIVRPGTSPSTPSANAEAASRWNSRGRSMRSFHSPGLSFGRPGCIT
jgi:hypothetical protein